MEIKLKQITIENFKCFVNKVTENFYDKTIICGANATGKTTIIDAFMWCLFDKNSVGDTKFQVRTLDKNGKPIDGTEISVETILDVDGKEICLKKVQKQKYVTKRGTTEREYQGNENSYEINGYPKSEKEYKEFVSGFVDEKLFRMVTSATYFTNLPWKEQREILTKIVAEQSDLEIALSSDEFKLLVPELEIASTEDISKKYTKAMSEWKKKQVELPARIDEVSKSIVSIDTAELELQKNAIKEKISDAEKSLEDIENASSECTKVLDEITVIRIKISNIEREEKSAIDDTLNKKKNDISKIDISISENNESISRLMSNISLFEKKIEYAEDEKVSYQNKWKEEKTKVFREFVPLTPINENDLICPACGQKLPVEIKTQKIADFEQRNIEHDQKYNNEKADFENKKNINLENIITQGNKCVADIKQYKKSIESLNEELDALNKKNDELKSKKSKCDQELSELPIVIDLTSNKEYQCLKSKLSSLKEKLLTMSSGADIRQQTKILINGLREELSMVEKEIAKSDTSAAEDRMEQLKEELRTIGQKVADQEKMIYLLETFIKKKMEIISKNINDKFKQVSFKLFENQINGGIKETCECTVNGVPFSSLNNGHKIIAGLDIIETLSKLYGISCPVFIDNAESVNDYNVPDMDCQMILFKVSNNDKFTFS